MMDFLTGQKGTATGLGRQMTRDATEYPFTEPRVTISARDHRAGADISGDPVKLFGYLDC